jgi:hypothetical protein
MEKPRDMLIVSPAVRTKEAKHRASLPGVERASMGFSAACQRLGSEKLRRSCICRAIGAAGNAIRRILLNGGSDCAKLGGDS